MPGTHNLKIFIISIAGFNEFYLEQEVFVVIICLLLDEVFCGKQDPFVYIIREIFFWPDTIHLPTLFSVVN